MKRMKITKQTMSKNARKVLSLIRSKPYLDTSTNEELAVELATSTISSFTNHKISVSFEMESDNVPRVWSDGQQKEINEIRATLAEHRQILDTHTTQIGLILTTVQEMQKQQQEMQNQIVSLSTKVDKISDKLDSLADKFDQHLKNHK